MYELLLIAGFIIIIFRGFSLVDDDDIDLPHKVSDRLGKLWDIVHQGMRDNRFLRAEKALLTILKIDEKNAAAYNRLGILYAKQKEYKDAIDCFEIACSIEPTASSLHNLGLIYYETENYEKAVTAFEEALKLDDSMAARHIALAKALEHLGNEKLMISHLEKATEIEPSKEALRLLSEGYKKRGDDDKAEQIDKKVSKLITAKSSASAPKKRLKVRRAKKVIV
jgi:tetratricopeptide (TPR) repeat protein